MSTVFNFRSFGLIVGRVMNDLRIRKRKRKVPSDTMIKDIVGRTMGGSTPSACLSRRMLKWAHRDSGDDEWEMVRGVNFTSKRYFLLTNMPLAIIFSFSSSLRVEEVESFSPSDS